MRTLKADASSVRSGTPLRQRRPIPESTMLPSLRAGRAAVTSGSVRRDRRLRPADLRLPVRPPGPRRGRRSTGRCGPAHRCRRGGGRDVGTVAAAARHGRSAFAGAGSVGVALRIGRHRAVAALFRDRRQAVFALDVAAAVGAVAGAEGVGRAAAGSGGGTFAAGEAAAAHGWNPLSVCAMLRRCPRQVCRPKREASVGHARHARWLPLETTRLNAGRSIVSSRGLRRDECPMFWCWSRRTPQCAH